MIQLPYTWNKNREFLFIGIANTVSAPSEFLAFLWRGGPGGCGQGPMYVRDISIVNYVLQIFSIFIHFCLETVLTFFLVGILAA